MTTSVSSTMSGWVAFATGAVGLLGAVSIAVFLTAGGPAGPINDVCNALEAILSAVLVGMLFSGQQGEPAFLSRFGLLMAVAGALLAVAGSALVLSGKSGWYLAALYLAVGTALLGLSLLALVYSARQGDWLPRGLLIFGLVCGIILALGLAAIPGLVRGTDTQEYKLTVANAMWWTGMLGWLILYPVWCILLGYGMVLRS